METTKLGCMASDRLDDFNGLMYVISRAISNKVNTIELVKVVAVNNGNVDLIPVVDRTDNFGNRIASSILKDVRVMRYQAGLNAVVIDPKVGDFGLALVCKRDISNIESGIIASNSEYNLNNSVYIGGVLGLNQTPTEKIEFTDNGIVITSTKGVIVNSPKVNINSTTEITLGTGATKKVARVGDNVVSGTTVIGQIQENDSIVRSL